VIRQATYRLIAADLRRAIETGEYAPGTTLPTISDLMARYGVAKSTARAAVRLLEDEGLVVARRRYGTVVRHRPDRQRIVKRRGVYRDELGYLFSDDSGDWRELRPTEIEYRPAPADLAPLLGVPTDTAALVRDRLLGDREHRAYRQIAVSWYPAKLVRGTVIERPRTGPGGTADRLEVDLGLGPLSWAEDVSAHAASPQEITDLALPPGVPVLRIVRVATSNKTGAVAEVCDTRLSGELYVARYPLRREPSARWPVRPASGHPTDPSTPAATQRDTPSRPGSPETEPNE
jgi:DNA-binding GntR family transcriptional regulator